MIVENYLFVEKYRPKILDDMVLSDEYRSIFQGFISNREVPHLLLSGPPGAGKTAISQILIRELLGTDVEMDLLALNGSSSTGVDVVRNLIEEFLKSPSFGDNSKTKLVFIDEADYLSVNAMAALRNVMETFHESGRFILTCNYISKIIDPLQSRCQSFEFKRLPKEHVVSHCEGILEKENIKYEKSSVIRVVNTFYPDVRKVINTLQSRSKDGELIIKKEDIESNEKLFRSFVTEIIVGVKTKNGPMVNTGVQSCQKLLNSVEVDYQGLYQEIFNDSNENIPMWAKIMVNKYSSSHQGCMIPAMNLMAMVFDIIRCGKELRGLSK